MSKRIIAAFLTLALLFGTFPATAFAAQTPAETVLVTQTPVDAEIETEETTESADGTAAVTRAQWLQMLVAAFSLTIEDDIVPDNYFPDLSEDAQYYEDFLVAVYHGLVDVLPNSPVEPEAAATREFAAFTLNVCMGYLPEEAYSFAEAAEVTYPDDIQVAIEQGWFTLTNGAFLPDQAITAAEFDLLKAAAESYVADFTIESSHESQYSFKAGIIEITEEALITVTDGITTVTVSGCSQPIAAGDRFVVYSGGLAIPYQAESVVTNGTDTVITASDLYFEDAIETMDVQLENDADPGNFYAAEDTELIFIEESTGTEYSQQAVMEQMASGSKSVYIPKFSKTLDLGNGVKFALTVELKNAKVCHAVDIGLLNGSASVWMEMNAEVSGKLSCALDEFSGDDIEVYIGGYEVPGIGGLSVYVKVDVTGSISVVKKYFMKVGIKVGYDTLSLKGYCNKIYKLNDKGSSINAELSAKIYLEVKFGLYGKAMPIKGYLYGEGGFKASVKYTTYEEIEGNCIHFAAYLYAEYGAKVEWGLLGWEDELDWNKEFIKESNSPVKLSFHYEDGVQVPTCTREDLNGTTTGDPSKIADSGYSTGSNSSYAGSGLSSGGSSTGYGSGGEPVIIYTYSLDEDNNATITGYSGNATSLTIPLKLDGYNVTAIGEKAFKGNTGLRTIIMQDNILTIGRSAFESCTNLRNVTLSENLTDIGRGAFYNCTSLVSIIIPDSVITIGRSAFEYCTALQYIRIGDGVTTIDSYAFARSGLKSLKLPANLETLNAQILEDNTGVTEITIPKTVTNMRANTSGYKGSFYGSAIKKVVFEEGITAIPAHALHGAFELTAVTIPSSVTTISASAFSDCTSLTQIQIPDSVTHIGNYAFAYSGLTSLELPAYLVTLDAQVLEGNTGVTEIFVPKTVTSMRYNTSGYKGSLYDSAVTEVVFEEGITAIPAHALHGAFELTAVTIPSSVTTISASAFSDCTSLAQLEIPDSVTHIGNYAFAYSGLTSLELPAYLVTLEAQILEGNTGVTEITIPKTVTSMRYNTSGYKGSFYDSAVTKVVFEEGRTIIPSHALQGAFQLTEVIIPTSVTTISSYAFADTALPEFVLPDHVTSIGTCLFEYCTVLESVTWNTSISAIPNYTFSGAAALETVVLPDSVTSIGENAFRNCDSLVTIALPGGLTSIGAAAFSECDSLASITLPESLTKLNSNTFYNCDALTAITIPYGVTTIGSSAFYDCDALETVTMANSVTSMGTNVFYHNDVLKNVTLSRNLTTIPSGSFKECAELAEIVIPYFTATIDGTAFNSSPKLVKVVVREKLTSISSTAFSYADRTVFYGPAGCAAQTWCTDNGYTFAENTSAATAVTMAEKTVTILKGSTHMLDFDVTPIDFADTITFRSSNTDVVTVDETGKLTAVGTGSATIRVNVGSVSTSCKVTVTQPVTKLTLDKKTLDLEVPNTFQLTATVAPTDASNQVLTWTSSNESAATVDENGLITAVGNGTAVITAATTDGSNLTASCTVTVTDPTNIPVASVTLDQAALSIEALEAVKLSASVSPADAANKALIWTSSDENVATVDENGTVTGVKKGSATITATAADGYGACASCTVTVTNNACIVTDAALLESSHPYSVNCTDFWLYTEAGADALLVTFDERTYIEDEFDYLYIFDGTGAQVGRYTGAELAGVTVEVPDDTVKIQLDSDDIGTEWGFKVTEVKARKQVTVVDFGWSGATQWTLTDDGTLTVYGTGNMKNYGYIGGQPWLGKGVDITSVVIEEGINAVGSGAFMNLTTLRSVSLPDSMTKMGEAAFYGSGLTSVEIPAGLWTIQPYTFKNCADLTSVKFNEGNLQKISDGAFYGTGLTELVLPDCLDILDVYAFKGCANLTDITIGSGLTELREAVFYGTAIPTITIPEGITKIGPYAFKNCVALETVDLPESLTSVGEASFYACTALKAIDLPDAVTTIGNYAFRKCAAMETLTFGSELVSIGECSFYGCSGLTEIVIPDKVTTIKPYAFKTCTGLTSVTLGSSVETIGEGAFNTCTGLKTMVFPARLTAIGDYCFSGSYNLWKLTFQGNAPAIGTGAFKGLNATAYYPGDNASWTASVMQNYGGKITWTAN